MRRLNLRWLGLLVFLAAVAVLLAAPATFTQQQKVLHLYTALDVNEAKIYIDAFEKSHPDIKVEWVRLSAGEVLARLEAEASNPQVSLWFGGPSDTYIVAKEKGLLAPYKESLGWQYLPKKFKDPDGYWSGIYTGFIGFASNTEFLKKHNLEPPKSWYDLLKPEFKGEIAMAYPYTSGTAYTTLATIIQLMGDDGWDYVKKLDAQMAHYTRAGSACVTEVGLGEVAVGIAFSHDILAKGIAKGYPETLSFPKEGTGYEIGGIALVKGGPEPELAKVFYDWMLSADAQSLYKAWFRVPLNPEAEVGEGVITADQVNLINYDAKWAAEHRDELIDKWRQITGK